MGKRVLQDKVCRCVFKVCLQSVGRRPVGLSDGGPSGDGNGRCPATGPASGPDHPNSPANIPVADQRSGAGADCRQIRANLDQSVRRFNREGGRSGVKRLSF
ncbi:hypothetical protein GCM10027256_17400 [Novispirillum itersonii subsp. nipponicum]